MFFISRAPRIDVSVNRHSHALPAHNAAQPVQLVGETLEHFATNRAHEVFRRCGVLGAFIPETATGNFVDSNNVTAHLHQKPLATFKAVILHRLVGGVGHRIAQGLMPRGVTRAEDEPLAFQGDLQRFRVAVGREGCFPATAIRREFNTFKTGIAHSAEHAVQVSFRIYRNFSIAMLV